MLATNVMDKQRLRRLAQHGKVEIYISKLSDLLSIFHYSDSSLQCHLNAKHVAASTSTKAKENVRAPNTTKQSGQLKYRYAIKI